MANNVDVIDISSGDDASDTFTDDEDIISEDDTDIIPTDADGYMCSCEGGSSDDDMCSCDGDSNNSSSDDDMSSGDDDSNNNDDEEEDELQVPLPKYTARGTNLLDYLQQQHLAYLNIQNTAAFYLYDKTFMHVFGLKFSIDYLNNYLQLPIQVVVNYNRSEQEMYVSMKMGKKGGAIMMTGWKEVVHAFNLRRRQICVFSFRDQLDRKRKKGWEGIGLSTRYQVKSEEGSRSVRKSSSFTTLSSSSGGKRQGENIRLDGAHGAGDKIGCNKPAPETQISRPLAYAMRVALAAEGWMKAEAEMALAARGLDKGGGRDGAGGAGVGVFGKGAAA
ncbi:hypothetical protein ACQ4PT_061213 [Festuca glaucescens]